MNSSFLLILVAAVIGFFILFKKFRFQQHNKRIKSSSLSLASQPSSSISTNWIHHVFPSFHGPDVRKGFLSHILESFKRRGIDPFIDNDIERSKPIGHELIEAIRGSRIGIVLLSKNYAYSSWCLDELVEIMMCREVLGQIVITIFFNVSPTDVRKQTGAFGEAFRKTCKGKPKEHIERWRKALEDVAGIAGMDSGAWDNEAAMIEKLTNEVLVKLQNFTPPRDFKELVGMNSHMEEIKRLFGPNVNEGRMIGIWGPPGIGKTTIARFLFHQLSSRFQLRAIMVNIKFSYPRPCLDEYNARLQLQHQMLLKISNQKEVPNLELALNGLKDKKVLLVLDEVDRIEQVHALAKEIGLFGPGSYIIITTENRRILEAQGIKHIYQVKSPSSEEAFKIFCMYAFGKEYPDDGFYELACEATDLAGELPLGLKVLGSTLRGMPKQEWKMEMPTLRNCLHGEIESIIKFSYNALSDEEKDLFLYIACFFNFHNKAHQVEVLLANKFSNVKKSLHVLVEKSFMSISSNEFIMMHTLLLKFGRETARKQDVHGIKKRRLLVDARDICDDTIDCSKVIGIQLDFFNMSLEKELNEMNISVEEELNDLNIIEEEELNELNISEEEELNELNISEEEELMNLNISEEELNELNISEDEELNELNISEEEELMDLNISEEELNELNISEKAVERMFDVQFIRIIDDGNCFERLHSILYHSQKIRYLEWHYFQNKSLPVTFNPESLVELDMTGSNLEKLWEGNKPLNCLKWMYLSYSQYLKELPDLSTAINLEDLNIRGCSSLRKLKKFHLLDNQVSFQHSDSLTCIDATDCKSLERLDCSFNNPDICLKFINCFKLDQKARNLIMHTPTSKYAVLPGKHVPTCFNYRATDGGSLTIKLTETSFPTSLRFQACIILKQTGYAHEPIDYVNDIYQNINIMVRNSKEKRDYWYGYKFINSMVKNKCRSIHPKTEHIYTFEVEVSEVTSTELVFEFKTDYIRFLPYNSWWEVGECGLLQILEKKNEP